MNIIIESQNIGKDIMEGEKKSIFSDASLYFLIVANLFSVYFAFTEHWDITTVMLVYLAQSIIIGFFNFIRILTLKEFSTDKFKINNKSVSPTKGTKMFTAFFFLFHYGMFHLTYLVFVLEKFFSPNGVLNAGNSNHSIITITIVIGIALFFVNHAFSFFYNREADSRRRPNIGRLMFFPYARILPMHMTIIFGSFIGGVFGNNSSILLLFLVLKMIADVLSHIFEHAGVEDVKEKIT